MAIWPRSETVVRVPGTAYRKGLLVGFSNSKAAMMWAAVSAYLRDAGAGPTNVLAFTPYHFDDCNGCVWWTCATVLRRAGATV